MAARLAAARFDPDQYRESIVELVASLVSRRRPVPVGAVRSRRDGDTCPNPRGASPPSPWSSKPRCRSSNCRRGRSSGTRRTGSSRSTSSSTTPGDGLSPRARQRIRAELGSHGDLLTFTSSDLLGADADLASSGWRSQQILKLMVATAAHHRPLRRARREEPLHRVDHPCRLLRLGPRGARTEGSTRSSRHPLRPQLEHVAVAFGLDPALAVQRFTATAPPVVLDCRVVNAIVADVGGGDPHRFPVEFERSGYTEFFLYSAWQIARGATPDDLVSGRSLASPTVSGGCVRAEPTFARCSIRRMPPTTTTLAIHRRALAKLSPESVHDLAEFWARHGLFGTSGGCGTVHPTIPNRVSARDEREAAPRADVALTAPHQPSSRRLRSRRSNRSIVRSSPRSRRTIGSTAATA